MINSCSRFNELLIDCPFTGSAEAWNSPRLDKVNPDDSETSGSEFS